MRTLIGELLQKRNDYSIIAGSCWRCQWCSIVLFIDVMKADRNEYKMIYY